MGTKAYHRWTSTPVAVQSFTILPDGCRDIIISPGKDRAVITDWDMVPRRVTLGPGKRQIGFRLQPGLSVTSHDLADISDEQSAVQLIAKLANDHSETIEAIAALAAGQSSISTVSIQLGVTPRSLQRQFKRQGLPSPEFWQLLGRARRAVLGLSSGGPLADLAAEHGYSDQAHMARECKRWFGHSPGALRQQHTLLRDLSQPGLGTWTGEHISIR